MRWLPLCFLLLATPALAQEDNGPGFLDRLFGTDTAESDAEQGSLLERLIEDSLSGAGRSVTVTGFRGALSGRATLDSLTIADADGIWLTLTDAELDWNRAALFAGRLEVTELSAAEILVPRLSEPEVAEAPSPEAGGGFRLPDLPVSVNIGRIAAERVELGEALFGVESVISLEGSASLGGGEGAADLDIVRLDQPGAIRLDAAYQNESNVLRLDLTMEEGKGGIVSTLAGLPGAPAVDFSIRGEAPFSDFTAEISLATDGVERLAGQVNISETESARRLVANIGGDIAPVFAPQFRDFFGDTLTLEAEALLQDDGRIIVPDFSLFARELALFGSVELTADKMPRIIDITGRIAPENGDTVLLPLAGSRTEVSRANLAVQFDAEQSEDYVAVIRLADFAREGIGATEVVLRTTGRIGAGSPPEITGAVDFDVTGFTTTDGLSDALGAELTGNAAINWAGGPVTINRFTLDARDLHAQGGGTIAEDIRVTALLEARRLANFADFANRPLSGQAMLETEGTFNPLTGAFNLAAKGQTTDLAIGDARADAILAGVAQLDLEAVRDTDGLRINLTALESEAANLTGSAILRSGGSTATLEGQLSQTALVLPGVIGASEFVFSGQETETRDWNIATTLAAPALTAKLAGLLSNIYDLPAFQGTINAASPDLSIFSEVAGRPLSGSLSLDAEGGANADLTRLLIDGTASSNNLSIGDARIDPLLRGELAITITGARTEDRVDIEALEIDGDTLTASLQGAITGLTGIPAFEGSVTARTPDLGVFSALARRPLSGAFDVTATGAARADLSLARVDGKLSGQDISFGIDQLDRLLRGPLELSLVAGREDEEIEITTFSLTTNALTAETSGQLGAEGDRLAVQARLNDVSPLAPGFNGALSVVGSLGREGETIAVDLDAIGPGGVQASIDGTVAQDFSTTDLAIGGTAPLALANGFIAPRSLAGTTRFDLRLTGRPALESLSGQASLSGARFANPGLPTALEDITGTIALSGGSATLDIGAIVESGGRVTMSGPVGLTAPNSAALQIDLNGVRLTDPNLYETTANGQIRVEGPLAGGAMIAGDIALGETNIRIPNSGLGGAGAIPEITHINEPPPVRGTRRRAGLLNRDANGGSSSGPIYGLDIRVSAPNRVFLRGRGLDSEFGGAFRITGTTANVVPIGAFELIRGRLDILGNRLELDSARITVQGSLIPFLNIRATTRAEDTDVTVAVLGPADNPEIRFSSAPELPQEEVLARLIFGRGLETLSPLQAARLAIAVRTLAGQGGEGVVGKIRGKTGLADLDVTTNEDGNAAVRAGAYLGENVYSDITVDSAGETQLNLNLDVTPSLTLRGGVTNEGESSLGIFFERDY